MKYSLACICGYETPHVENKKDVDDELIYIHQKYCEMYIKSEKDELTSIEIELILGLVTQAIEELGLGEMEYLKPLQKIETKLKRNKTK